MLDGQFWNDLVCFAPTANELTDDFKNQSCIQNYNFLALRSASGLPSNADGILGLSPNKNNDLEDEHILPQMRAAGMIDEASVSFSIANKQMEDESYAVFGGVNPDQIVGGD